MINKTTGGCNHMDLFDFLLEWDPIGDSKL